jgi:cytosine/uracil/thiamine/allantoin permease
MKPRVKISGEYSYQGGGVSWQHLIKGLIGFAFVLTGTSAVTTHFMARSLNYTDFHGIEPLLKFKQSC